MPLLYMAACVVVFLLAYTLNLLYVSVFYHRALTHRAVKLTPWLQKVVVHTGNWVTGLDPKGWVCMHRMHHAYSDTNRDPHSPVPRGIWSVLLRQLYSYRKTLAGLIINKPSFTSVVLDLEFPVSWLNRRQLWLLPYLLHLAIALSIGIFCHAWILAGCYWVGMMSHPIQGWMVNALAHRFGYRNYPTADNSKNNSMVAWLVFGEGYQNNHHQFPLSPKFSIKWWEVDMGYALCRGLSAMRLLKFT